MNKQDEQWRAEKGLHVGERQFHIELSKIGATFWLFQELISLLRILFMYKPMHFQVMGSKTKIFIVMEFVTGGELFDKIVSAWSLW